MKNFEKFKKHNLIERPLSTKFKSVFEKEGNPFKYFNDIKRYLNPDSTNNSTTITSNK